MLRLPYNRAFRGRGDRLAYADLRDWMAALERAGELKKIRAEGDPILETTENTERVGKLPGTAQFTCEGAHATPGGPALLFHNIQGHPGSQVLINQYGS